MHKMICSGAEDCKILTCPHSKPHAHGSYCNSACMNDNAPRADSCGEVIVPAKKTNLEIQVEELTHEIALLRREMSNLTTTFSGVRKAFFARRSHGGVR